MMLRWFVLESFMILLLLLLLLFLTNMITATLKKIILYNLRPKSTRAALRSITIGKKIITPLRLKKHLSPNSLFIYLFFCQNEKLKWVIVTFYLTIQTFLFRIARKKSQNWQIKNWNYFFYFIVVLLLLSFFFSKIVQTKMTYNR